MSISLRNLDALDGAARFQWLSVRFSMTRNPIYVFEEASGNFLSLPDRTFARGARSIDYSGMGLDSERYKVTSPAEEALISVLSSIFEVKE